MTQLPKGWVEVEVAEIAQVIRGVTYSKPEATTSPGTGRIALLRATNIGRELALEDVYYVPSSRVSEAQHLRPGDVVVATSSGSLSVVGKSARLRHTWEGTFGAFCSVLRSHPALSEAYLSHAVASPDVRQEWSELARGSNINNLRSGHLTQTRIPLAPRAEQERIVAAIEEAFSLIDAGEAGLHATRARLKRMRDSVLAAAVTGQLVPQDPADTPAASLLAGDHGTPELARITDLPSGWVVADLGSVAEMSLGKMLDARAQTGQDPHHYLRNVNVRWFRFELDSLLTMDVRPSELDRVTIRAGDLVVCEGGEPGRCAVWSGEAIVIQKALHRVRPMVGVRSDYLAHVLRWWTQQDGFSRFVTGTTIKHLPKEKLRLLPIPLPPPEEQARLVAEVERQFSFIEAAERAVDAALVRAAGLRRSVLKAAFEGRLVPQDPSDEPASVLLERIAAEREDAPKVSRRGRAKVVAS